MIAWTKSGIQFVNEPTGLLDSAINVVEDKAKEMTYEIVMGVLGGLRDLVVDLSYSIALIGGGIAIILHVAGWEKGTRWAGILTVCYVLIKYLLG